MKHMALIPLAVLLVGAAGFGLCQAAGWNPHGRAMLLAGGVGILAALLGYVPLIFVRSGTQMAVAQAALAGTVLQMVFSLALGGAGWMMQKVGDRSGYVWWLLAFYWASLIALVLVFTRAIRQAGAGAPWVSPAEQPPRQSGM